MRRVLLVLALMVLAAAPIMSNVTGANAQPGPCTPRSDPDKWWFGVCEPMPLDGSLIENPIQGFEILEAYSVPFEEAGAVTNPMLDNTEFMVVRVTKGEFILDLGAKDFLETGGATPTPGDQAPEVLIVSPDPVDTFGRTLTDENEIDYEFLTQYQPASGDCTVGCPVDPLVPVRANAGDLVFVPNGTFCLWCLINALDAGIPDPPEFEKGVLEVYVVSNTSGTFSWRFDWQNHIQAFPDPVTIATLQNAPAPTTRFSWAFNPGSTCRGG